MVRTAPLAGLALLGGCGNIPMQGQESAPTASAHAVAEMRVEIAQLRTKVAVLEHEQERDRNYVKLVAASLDEARENHDRLLETSNANAQRSNKRDAAQEADIDWLMQRQGVAR